MTAGQTLYEASTGFGTPWDKLSLPAQARWERWAGLNHTYTVPKTTNTGLGAVIQIAFSQNLNMLLLLDSRKLTGWGGPDFENKGVTIQLDAAYAKHQDPKFTTEALELTLSFDTLRRVAIPWSAIVQCNVVPHTPDPTEAA